MKPSHLRLFVLVAALLHVVALAAKDGKTKKSPRQPAFFKYLGRNEALAVQMLSFFLSYCLSVVGIVSKGEKHSFNSFGLCVDLQGY